MTDYPKPAWAKALDIEAQSALDNIKLMPSYVTVTVQDYGYFDLSTTRQLAADFELANWVAAREKRAAYLKTPEGIAEQKRKQEEEDAREKREAAYRARFQWLHDKLVSKGCECNHEDCYY